MIISYSRLSTGRLLRGAQVLGKALLLLACVWAVSLVLLGLQGAQERKHSFASVNKKKPGGDFVLDSIGSGSLALSSKQQLGWVSDLARQLIVIACNSRPDAPSQGSSLLIGVKAQGEEILLENGKVLFLEEKEGRLVSSEQPTPLWARPTLLGQEGVLIEVGRKVGALVEEKSQFVIQTPPGKIKQADLKFFAAFKQCELFEKDLLWGLYGGKQFEDKKDKQQLAFQGSGGGYVCSVAVGEELVWKEGQWRAKGEESSLGLPLAKVVSLSSEGIKIKVWDETGFGSEEFSFKLKKGGNQTPFVGFSPTAVHFRTPSQVSCLFGKKRVVVKKGDWLMKTGAHVRNLRRPEDVRACLEHRLSGELLVIDALEKGEEGWVLSGHVFDPMRTQVASVSFPVAVEKQKKNKRTAPKGRKKR